MLVDTPIAELAKGLREKLFSSEDILKECYDNIEKSATKTNAFITIIDRKEALAIAQKRDNERTITNSPLHGIPFVLKDSYVTKGIRTTAASHVLSNYIPQYNASVYSKLLQAGAILVGKMNMDAWGHGGSSENTDFGAVKNPWDTSRVAGGSGGGPAVAIASRMAVFGISEDTGGSIRNPAAWTNTTGLKVTYGRVSRYGCIAYASSFDTVGPVAKTVADCAYVLATIAGKDPYDATSSPHPIDAYTQELSQEVKDLVIGMPKEFYGSGLHQEIKETIYQASKELEKLGVRITEISMPLFDYGIPVYYLIGPSETSSNLARYDGMRYGQGREYFTAETMRRIMIGTYALSSGYYDAYYRKAQQVRTLFIKEYEKALSICDAILMPVNPTPAPKMGELISDPLQNFLADVYTTSQNPVGVPALALPCGFTKTKLPIGMQLVGNMFSESLLLRIGHAYQRVTHWHKEKPGI